MNRGTLIQKFKKDIAKRPRRDQPEPAFRLRRAVLSRAVRFPAADAIAGILEFVCNNCIVVRANCE